jgi:glycosyltransferase involved in cell wall biosynthesis
LNKSIGPKILFLHNYRAGCAKGTNFRDNKVCTSCKKSSFPALKFRCYKNSFLGSLAFLTSSYRRNIQSSYSKGELKIVSLSQLSSEKLQEILLIPKIAVIPNSTPDFTFGKEAARRINNDSWVYAGRLSSEKGILELVQVWPDEYTLDIFGDGPLREDLQNLILSKENISLKDNLPRRQLQERLTQYTGGIIPSLWYEVDPLIYSEYLSFGLPVIASYPNSVALSVERDSSGVAIHELSTLQIQKAISQISTGYEHYVKNARGAYERNRSEKAWLDKFEDLANQTINDYLKGKK